MIPAEESFVKESQKCNKGQITEPSRRWDGSKPVVNAALLHDLVGCMSRFDFSVNSDIGIGDRAEPDVVMALAMTDKIAAVQLQNITDFLLIFSHRPLPDRFSRRER